jgi:hypothetical protein
VEIIVDAPMWQVALTFGLTVVSVWLVLKGLSALWAYALGRAKPQPPTGDDAEFTPAQGLRIAADPDYLISHDAPAGSPDEMLAYLVAQGKRLDLIDEGGRHRAGPGRPSVSDGLADLAEMRLPTYQVQSGEISEDAAPDDADLTDAEFRLGDDDLSRTAKATRWPRFPYGMIGSPYLPNPTVTLNTKVSVFGEQSN